MRHPAIRRLTNSEMSNPADRANVVHFSFSIGVSIILNWMVRCLIFRLGGVVVMGLSHE